jgi:pimeloyl-ACP methyl ester carboxylesterase
VLHQLGVRLITYDRPGYGNSDRLGRRRVAHAAKDVAAIADHLELDRFAVVGRSGGGPHALACAALLSDRVTRAAALVTLAPPDAAGLDWYAGMAASNVKAYQDQGSFLKRAGGTNADSLMGHLDPEMPVPDRQVVSDVGIRRMLVANFKGALRTRSALDAASAPQPGNRLPHGWIDDVLSFRLPWEFDPMSITRVPVLLWHGERDVFSPVGHFRWLADRIRGATAVLEPDTAHFGALAVLPQVLRWLLDSAVPRR